MLEIINISVRYGQGHGAREPLHQAHASFESGAYGLMGPSGSGKSTLLRIIAGLQAATSGSVGIDGLPVQLPTRRQAGDPRVSLIHQDYRLVDFLSVEDNLRLCAELHDRRLSSDQVMELLARVGVSELAARLPGTLSGGEQQRVAIARGVASGANIILADEPTGALDAENSMKVTDLLVDLALEPGLMVIIATHDPAVAARLPVIFRIIDGKLVPQSATVDS